LVHPIEVMEIRGYVRALELWTGGLVKRPAIGALASVRFGRAVQIGALPDIEACQMTARSQRCPDNAVGVNINAARVETRRGNLEDLSHTAIGGIGAPFQPDEVARKTFSDAPNGIIKGTRNCRIQAVADQRIQLRIEWRLRL